MSCLKLHWPLSLSLYPPSIADWQPEVDADDDAPVILKFPRTANRIAGRIGPNLQRDLLSRVVGRLRAGCQMVLRDHAEALWTGSDVAPALAAEGAEILLTPDSVTHDTPEPRVPLSLRPPD